MSVRDTRLMARAITERWAISPEYRTLIVQRLMRIIADPESSNREITSAARALISADLVNSKEMLLEEQKVQHADRMKNERLARVSQVAQQLGLTRVVEAIAVERSASDLVGDGGD